MRGRWGAIAALGLVLGCTGDGDDRAQAPTGTSNTSTQPPCEPPPLGEPRPELDQVVTVLLYCDGSGDGADPDTSELVAVRRVVPADRAPIDATLQQLFLGETSADSAAGLHGIGGPYLGATYIETRVASGVATVHLRESFTWENNLGTATASAFAYYQLEANIFQFDEITGLEYIVGGERWCGFENFCEPEAPYPYFTRN